MQDFFNFKLINRWLGYNSASDKSLLAPGFLIRGSKNTYLKRTGTVATRPGLLRRGTADSTDAGIKSSTEWDTSLGSERVLRVVDGKLQLESDIVDGATLVWYELFAAGSPTTSLAATLTRFVFDTWWNNTEKKDRLLFVRGDGFIFHWSGGLAKVLSATATTITKANGSESWAQAGFTTTSGERTIMIDGVEYTYTGGEVTDTLTGVTPSPVSVPVDAIAIQSVQVKTMGVGDMIPTGYEADFLKTIGNQLWVGSYSSRAIYISSDSDFSDFSDFVNSGTYVTGDPDLVVLDNKAKGIGVQNGKAIVFAGDSDLYVITPNFELPTFSSSALDRLIIQKVEKKPLTGFGAALGHEFLGNFGGEFVWLDQKNQLRALGVFSNVDEIKPVLLSIDVQDELSEDDFTGGHLRAIDDTIYITAPNNGRDWMYQIREVVDPSGQVVSQRIWHPPQIRGISRFVVISSVIYGHHNINPQIYQIWDTNQWHDDAPDDEPIPYTCVARTPYMNHGGSPFSMRKFNMFAYEGYMTEGVELFANVYFDYQGATNILATIINDSTKPARFYTGTFAPSLGDFGLGDNPLGDGLLPEGGDQELVPRFKKIVDMSIIDHFEYSVEVYSVNPDSRWELITMGPNIQESTTSPVFLRK